jgi:predicted tellurium resistance membrane protein TerC
MLTRILLLLSISWIIRLTEPIFSVLGEEFSGRDLILLGGGLFLLGKSTFEIHEKLEGVEGHSSARIPPSFAAVIGQIILLDIVFSLDSVITAVGTADEVEVMIAAVMIAVLVMLVSAGSISEFVERHPTVKMLALSFLLLIGMSLVAESLDQHIPKGYIYFAMAFSVFVEVLNLRLRRRTVEPVHLRAGYTPSPAAPPQPSLLENQAEPAAGGQ